HLHPPRRHPSPARPPSGREAGEPNRGPPAATLGQLFRWLDAQMQTEAIGPVYSLVSARLHEPVILYALASEAIEPVYSLTGITLDRKSHTSELQSRENIVC